MKCRAEILKNVDSVPPIPVVAVRMARLLGDPEVSLDQLGETMKYDPALTAKVLRLANSTCFASSRTVATIKDAMVRLGISPVARMVIVSSVQPVLNGSLDGYGLEAGELWRHSVAVGLAAVNLKEVLGSDSEDGVVFTAGLLHDIGKLVIGSFIDRYFKLIQEKTDQEGISFVTAEKEVLGIDHTELGSAVLEQWSFPPELVTVVKWHHEPDRATEHQNLADLVHLADVISMMMGIGLGSDGLQYIPSSDSMSRLGLKKETLELVACRTVGAVEEIMEMFENSK
ncbi:HDOD domain-containing protein [Gemmatimonadota bacterium]